MNTSLAIMQPAFLPWAGYFNLMEQADYFVFLDDVQLEKQSWQTRNRILVGKSISWLSVSVINKSLSQLIVNTEINNYSRWAKKVVKTFDYNYSRHPCYKDAREVLDFLATLSPRNLAELNERLICYIADKLGISTPTCRSSDLNIRGSRSDRLIAFCEYFQVDVYVSPIGAAEYLEADRFAEKSSVDLRFQNYTPEAYKQFGMEDFCSHLSILDVVSNLGWERASKYIRGAYCENK